MGKPTAVGYINYGVSGGGPVGQETLTPAQCYGKALEIDKTMVTAWLNLANSEGGQVGDTMYTAAEAALEALKLKADSAPAWNAAGVAGGVEFDGRQFDKKACFQKAVDLDPNNAVAAQNLANSQ